MQVLLNIGAPSELRLLQPSQIVLPFSLLWSHFFVTVHVCVHIVERYYYYYISLQNTLFIRLC
jgi:hypothetical protein